MFEQEKQRMAQRELDRLINFYEVASDPENMKAFHDINREAVEAFNTLGQEFMRMVQSVMRREFPEREHQE